MKKFFLFLLVLVVIAIAGVLIYAATLPGTFKVERSIDVNAPAEKIYPMIADFHGWPQWSPFEDMDPAMKRIYSGTASGKGALYFWEGNENAGKGSMEITETNAPKLVRIKIDFSAPMAASNMIDFVMAQTGTVTRVTWAMYGPNSYVSKIFQIFMSMDKMVGNDFEKGLARLKTAAESTAMPKKPAK